MVEAKNTSETSVNFEENKRWNNPEGSHQVLFLILSAQYVEGFSYNFLS
jgi:hypothetical protein